MYLVLLINCELDALTMCKTVESMELVRKAFNEYASGYVEDWNTFKEDDKDCYFECGGIGDSDYLVQWIELIDGEYIHKLIV